MRLVSFSVEINSNNISDFLKQCGQAAKALNDAGFTIMALQGVDIEVERDHKINHKGDHTTLLDNLDRHAINNFGDEITTQALDKFLDFVEKHRYDPSSLEGTLKVLEEEESEEETR